MKYCGIDLHSNNSLVSVVDEEDHVVAEKRLPNDLGKIIGLIEPWRAELAGIVVESTVTTQPPEPISDNSHQCKTYPT